MRRRKWICQYFLLCSLLLLLLSSATSQAEELLSNAIGTLHPKTLWSTSKDLAVVDCNAAFEIIHGKSFFSNGFCVVRDRISQKVGYVDAQFNQAIPCRYDDAFPFFEKRAVVYDKLQGFAVLDSAGKFVIPFSTYDSIFPYSEGLAQVVKNGKVGYVDAGGLLAIPCQFKPYGNGDNAMSHFGHFSDGIAVVENTAGASILINKKGEIVLRISNPISSFSDGFILCQEETDFIFLDDEGVNKFGEKFEEARPFSESLAFVKYSNGKRAFIDVFGEDAIVLPSSDTAISGFKEGYAVIKRDSGSRALYYHISTSGRILSDSFFRKLTPFHNGIAGFSRTTRSSGILFASGGSQTGIYTVWSSTYSPSSILYERLQEGFVWWYAEVSRHQSSHNLIFLSPGAIRLDDLQYMRLKPLPKYLSSPFSEKLACSFGDTRARSGFVDRDYKFIIKPEFSSVTPFSDGFAAVSKKGKLWGYIDKKGNFRIPPLFSFAGQFCNGVAIVKPSTQAIETQSLRMQNGDPCIYSTAVVSKSGNAIFGVYGNILPALDGVFACNSHAGGWFADATGNKLQGSEFWKVRPMIQVRAFVQRKGSSRMSLIDSDFKLLSGTAFDDARFFSENLCAIKIGSKWGYCNRFGEITIKPQFESAFEFENGKAPISLLVNGTKYWDLISPEGVRLLGKNNLSYIHYGTMMSLFPPEMFRND